MRGAVAGRRWADFEIPAPLPRVCSHIRGAEAGGSAISWGQWWFGARGFEADVANWVLDPFLAERFLPPLRHRFATAHVWTHVMICVEANFPPASTRACVNVPLTFMLADKNFYLWQCPHKWGKALPGFTQSLADIISVPLSQGPTMASFYLSHLQSSISK